MSKFKVGDIVRVTNWDMQYCTGTSWFTKHARDLKLEWMINYRYGNYLKNSEHNPDERFIDMDNKEEVEEYYDNLMYWVKEISKEEYYEATADYL